MEHRDLTGSSFAESAEMDASDVLRDIEYANLYKQAREQSQK